MSVFDKFVSLRVAFDNPQTATITLSADECIEIATDLIAIEQELEDEHLELASLRRENRELRARLEGRDAVVIPFPMRGGFVPPAFCDGRDDPGGCAA